MNRIKAVVIGLFAAYWVVVIVLLISARPVFDVNLDQQTRVTGDHRPAELATVFVLTVLLSLLSVGVLLGWRWTFWLILVVFMAGILRVPAAFLELTGRLSTQAPEWYVGLTALVGLIQFCIAVTMLAGYRRAGIWGDV